MKKLITYQIDSFTKEKFKGNPAGVVLNADGLSDEQMQSIARELNNSETAFLLGGYLIQNKIVDCQGCSFEFTGKQGEKIGRPGIINVKVKIADGIPSLIQIKGDAIVIFKTEIILM